jgi:hypothetical protein
MPGEDQGLAQSIYLANMFAQRNTCQCTACQLLRKATDGMIKQVLTPSAPGQGGLDPAALTKIMAGMGGQGAEG